MKLPIVYTVLSAVNLVAAAVVTAFLPELVAVHFSLSGAVDRLGSAWLYIAFPAAAALLSLAVFLAGYRRGKPYARLLADLFAAIGALAACAGWTFLGLCMQNAGLGDTVLFPYAAVTAFPLSLVTVSLGGFLFSLPYEHVLGIRTSSALKDPALWGRVHRTAGSLVFCAGMIAAGCAIFFTCFPVSPRLDWIALVIWNVLFLLSFLAAVLLARGKGTPASGS